VNLAWKEGLSSGVYSVEHRLVREDGKIIWVTDRGQKFDGDENENSYVVGAVTDITDRKNAEEIIEKSLKEKETLLKEIHHRVKNNLQVVSSLLSLQRNKETDHHTTEILKESERRVKVMAQLHETLHQSNDLNSININDYLNTITSTTINLLEGDEAKITYTCDIEDLNFGISQSMALGQILSELISNCAKHAFVDRDAGNIKVELYHLEDNKVELNVVDDGNGFPDNFNIEESSTLGLQLTQALVQQLDGKLSVDNSQGARIRIIFEKGPL
jgi:two-component sensor histidine kinase